MTVLKLRLLIRLPCFHFAGDRLSVGQQHLTGSSEFYAGVLRTITSTPK